MPTVTLYLPAETIARGTVPISKQEVLVMNKYPFGAKDISALAVALAACAVMVVCGGICRPAGAADRTVLCEEFTNIW